MITVIVFILILALLVLIHEFGHFIAAKKSGVYVEEFGFGFPPRVFGKKIGETLYSINLLPIGGFVKLYGEEYHENAKETDGMKNRAFVNKKPWQKVIIVVAGIIGNFLLGWVLISFLFTQGVPAPTNQVIVENVQKNSPAANAGIINGDVIINIEKDNKTYPLASSSDLIAATKKFGDQEIIMHIKSHNKDKTVTVVPRKNPPAGQGALGVVITSFVTKKYPWYSAPFYGLKEAFSITKMIIVELSKTIFTLATLHKPKVDVAGPIGIAQFTGQAIKFGNNAVLELIALLSLNLAVINILPFPALDGGRLVLIIYEWVSGKRVNKTFEKYLNMTGIIILLSMTVLVTIHDILKLIK